MDDDDSNDEEDDDTIMADNPTARLTAKGGYAHTRASKLRISKANRGNTPWNKVRFVINSVGGTF